MEQGWQKDNKFKKGNIMKKIVLTVMAVMSLTMASASNASSAVDYTMDVNMNSLARTLSLTEEQRKAVEDIQATFRMDMDNVAAADTSDRAKLTHEALRHTLKRISAVLDHDQMRTYLRILNITFINRGINFTE